MYLFNAKETFSVFSFIGITVHEVGQHSNGNLNKTCKNSHHHCWLDLLLIAVDFVGTY